jgi:iron complex transport system substrate-binding protein
MDLKPDLVLVSTAKCTVKTNNCLTNCNRRCELTINVANKLKNLGLNVIVLAPRSLGDVLENILTVGNATGNNSKSRELVKNLRKRIDIVVSRSNKISKKPRVYFEVWNNPYISVNSKTWIGNLINLAGGNNIFGDAFSEWPIIRPEDVIQRNPDIMLFPVIPYVIRFWKSFDAVNKRQGWSQISAIKHGRLYEILRDKISRPGPRLVETLELLENLFCTSF